MNKLIRAELDQRFIELKEETSLARTISGSKTRRARSVVTLAIKSYMAYSNLMQNAKLEEHFARYATYQIRLFLFAGNDTTSSTIVYVHHLLSQHPEALERMRKEHDQVFGIDTDKAADMLIQHPALLNQCKYTMAVIKEVLRLYPRAATMRAARPGISLTDRHGTRYPMDYVGATILHPAVHRNPRMWPHPDTFLSERFLVEQGHELFLYAPAFRPFEQGPRACIGQTLVWNEIQIALILTLRRFDIRPAYDE